MLQIKTYSHLKNVENSTKIQQITTTTTTTQTVVKVGLFDEAPEYLRDNEYIKHGYRINFNNTRQVMKSLFMLHNESVNIWSHLLGVVMVIVFIVYTSIFIKSHKNEIFNTLHLNLTQLNEDLKSVTDPVVRLLPNLQNFT